MEAKTDKPKPIEVPLHILSEEALSGLIDSFILREGTDYGLVEMSHEAKVQQIRKQLDRGDIKIVFDPESQSATLLTKLDWQKQNR